MGLSCFSDKKTRDKLGSQPTEHSPLTSGRGGSGAPALRTGQQGGSLGVRVDGAEAEEQGAAAPLARRHFL